MDELARVIAFAIVFGVVFALGDWILRALADRLDSRLQAGWRWLTLPIAAFVCFAGFLALRPLIVDQPRTPLWFVLGVTAIALLVAGATALGNATLALGRSLVSLVRGT